MNNHMDIEISKLGERGQIVIPLDIRKKIGAKKGEKFLIITQNHDVILRPLKEIKSADKIQEDIIDMQIANERWKEIERGEYTEYQDVDEFLKDMKNW